MIQELLDRHLRALTGLGSNVDEYLSDGIDAAQIREELTSAGLEVRADVVEYFSWRSPQSEETILYREAMFLPSIDEAVALRERTIAFMARNDESVDDFIVSPPRFHDYAGEDIPAYPGPPFLLPVSYLDSKDFVAIDTRSGGEGGRIYFCSQGNGGVFFLFESLAELLGVSTWLLEIGRWVVHTSPGYPSYLFEDDEAF